MLTTSARWSTECRTTDLQTRQLTNVTALEDHKRSNRQHRFKPLLKRPPWQMSETLVSTKVFASTKLPELKILVFTNHNNCLYSATNQHDDSSDDRIQAPQREPKFFAITAESNCQHDATKPDDINPKALRPPSSLTTELKPCNQSPSSCNDCTQQLLAQCHQASWRQL